MTLKKCLTLFLLLAFLLPGFQVLAGAPSTCAIHGKRCAATCKQKKKHCRLDKGTCKMARHTSKSGHKCPSFGGCRHETHPFSTFSVKELPGQRFFSLFLMEPVHGDYLTAENYFYTNPRLLFPKKPPQPLFS